MARSETIRIPIGKTQQVMYQTGGPLLDILIPTARATRRLGKKPGELVFVEAGSQYGILSLTRVPLEETPGPAMGGEFDIPLNHAIYVRRRNRQIKAICMYACDIERSSY